MTAMEDIWWNWIAADPWGPPEVPGAHAVQMPSREHAGMVRNWPVASVRLRTKSSWIIDGCVRYVAAVMAFVQTGSPGICLNWVSQKCPGLMPCKCHPGEHVSTTKNWPVGPVSCRSKSSWIIDVWVRYVAAAYGIWSNWVAGYSMGPSEDPGTHALQMPSRGTCRHGQEMTCEACEPLGPKAAGSSTDVCGMSWLRMAFVQTGSPVILWVPQWIWVSRESAGPLKVPGPHAMQMPSRRAWRDDKELTTGAFEP